MQALMTWIKSTLRRSWIGLLIVLAFWAIAAKAFNAYVRFPWLDMPTHFAGGLAIGNFFWAAIDESKSSVGVTPRLIQALCVIGLTALSAVCWEFAEFLSDTFLHSHLNLGVQDTLSDLFFGITGGVMIAIYHLIVTKSRQ